MPSKSKTKGNKFENDIVKLLNELYDTQEFSRTPNSGAMMGRSNWGKNQGLAEGVKRTLGSDIIVPNDYPFSIECKHYSDAPNYSQIIKGSDTKLDHWLAECVYDAINLNLHPLLFFKTNRKGTYFAVPSYLRRGVGMFQPDDSMLLVEHYLVYRTFVIAGIERFNLYAHQLKDYALREKEKMHEYFQHEDVKNLLKVLEER